MPLCKEQATLLAEADSPDTATSLLAGTNYTDQVIGSAVSQMALHFI
jgi:hypothetical protein